MMNHDFFRESHNKKHLNRRFFLNGFYSNKMAEKIKWSRFNTPNEAGRLPSHLGVSFSLKNILIPIVCDFWCLQVSSNWICKTISKQQKSYKQYVYIYTYQHVMSHITVSCFLGHNLFPLGNAAHILLVEPSSKAHLQCQLQSIQSKSAGCPRMDAAYWMYPPV